MSLSPTPDVQVESPEVQIESPADPKDVANIPLESKASSRKEKPRLFQIIRKKIDAFIEHYIFVIIMTLITIYALFADDIRSLIDDKSVDTGFFTFTSVCLGMFSFEIILSSIAKPGYFLGFFFWLDIISTLSLIFDIGWLSDEIFGTGSSAQGAAGAAQLARAGRASRVGTRAGRIVRVVRLIRLIRIVKLYKAAQTTLAQKEIHDDDEDDDIIIKEDTFEKTNTQKVGTAGMDEENNSKTNIPGRESLTKLPRKESKESVDAMRKDSGVQPVRKESGVQRKESDSQPVRKDSYQAAPLRKDSNQAAPVRKISSDRPARQTSLEDKKISHSETKEINKTRNPTLQKLATKDQKQVEEEKDNKFELPQETNVGKKLSDLTTKRVITLVMSVMLSIPVFSVDTYVQDFTSGESGLKTIYAMNETGDSIAYDIALQNYIKEHKDIRNPLIVVNVLTNYEFNVVDEDSLRESEKQYYNIEGDNTEDVAAYSVFDQRDSTHLDAILGIARTLFVTAVLTAAALYFSKDSNDLVLAPIESMLVKVKRIAENPLAAAQIEEEDALMMEKLEKEGKAKEFLKKNEGNYETNILEKTILKLGALLALGFGEAGSGIIAQNMSKSGDVDPMIPGKKVMAIFGFCDIRQFTDATEVLQEGVMVFVNEIAEIVHGTINSYSGAANKNIGDAFLLVWKFPEEEVEHDADDPSILKLKQSVAVNQLADMSVISFLKIWALINRSKKLDKYRHNKSLNERIKNYSVKMGYGLHVGWAIEGAIGSEYKIDASYLSPNVNMAARLEAATKQFGVPFLISGALYNLCTAETQKNLRHIDRVTVKGSIQPIDLYTCDVDIHRLGINQKEVDNSTRTAIEKKQARVETRMKRDDLREKAFAGKVRVGKKFNTDKDLLTMRKPFGKDFEEKFKEGMDNYISGNWSKARDLFESTLKMIPHKEKDGPSNTLLNYMGEFGYRAPHDWKGFRELTEK